MKPSVALTKEEERTGPNRLRAAIREMGVFALFIIAVVYATWPLAMHIRSRVTPDLGDPLEIAWILSWNAHALVHQPLSLFNANIFFPERLTLAYSENLAGLSIFGAPVFWVTHNAILTLNFTLILTYAAGGFCVYLLVRQLTHQRLVPILAGLAYAIAPYRLSAIGHLHVVALHILPLIFLFLFRLRRSNSWRGVPAIALSVALQFWSSLTGGVISLVGILAWGGWEILRLRSRVVSIGVRAGVGVLAGIILSLPVLLPYVELKSLHPEFQHHPSEQLLFSASPSSYLSPGIAMGPTMRPTYSFLNRHFQAQQGSHEKHLFPGFWLSAAFLAVLCLALAAIVRRRRNGGLPSWVERVGLFTAVFLAGFVFSLGPRLEAKPESMRMPFALFSFLTGGQFLMRVPARFASLTILGMAVVAGIGLSALSSNWRRSIALVALVALAIEAMPPAFPLLSPPPITEAHRMLSRLDGVVLALPTLELGNGGEHLTGTIPREAQHMLLSTAHFRPLLNGYGAFVPPDYWEFIKMIQDFPTTSSFQALKARGVTIIVVQTNLIQQTHWENVVEKLDHWKGVRRISEGQGVVIYDVSKAPEYVQ